LEQQGGVPGHLPPRLIVVRGGRTPPTSARSPSRLPFALMGAELSSTVGVVALVASALALVAVCLCAVIFRRLRQLRADQRAVLGEQEEQDLVAHAAALDASFRSLEDYVRGVAEELDGRLAVAETRLDGAIAHCGLIRYDAYNEMSG